MLAENIYQKDVLKQMKTLDENGKAVPFSIKFRTFNKFSKKGGKLKVYEEARLVTKEKQERITDVNSLRTLQPRVIKERKNPHHFANKTRNLKLPNGEIKKFRIRFIVEFNGKKMNY